MVVLRKGGWSTTQKNSKQRCVKKESNVVEKAEREKKIKIK